MLLSTKFLSGTHYFPLRDRVIWLIFSMKSSSADRMPIIIMANGLDRLEKLFTSSRRKEKVVQGKKVLEPKHVFPSPSYLRPTSIHMTPRDARGEERKCLAEDRGRSQSLPEPNFNEGWRSSERRSPKHNNQRQTQNDSIRTLPSPVGHNSDSSAAPRLSEFRFPEDALFRHDELAKISGSVSPSTITSNPPSSANMENSTQLYDGKRSFDCPPNHIFCQLNPQDSSSNSGTRHEENFNVSESLELLPSPIIVRSSRAKLRRQSITRSRSTTHSPMISPKQVLEPKFSLFPKQCSIPQFPIPGIISPPASDNGEDHSSSPIKRSLSTTSLPTPSSSAAPSLRSPNGYWTPGEDEDREAKRETWETWGCRHDDPTRDDDTPKSNDGIPRSRLLRKSASIATLSAVTSRIANEGDLREPTLDDFWGLCDDDIAETEVVYPTLNIHKAPTPPPKDTKYSQNTPCNLPVKSYRPATVINPMSGDITPPCTPTNSNFLTLECGLYGNEGTQGALWCARIAGKYHFDMVYVVSLWPNAIRTHWDPSRRLVADSPTVEISPTSPLGCPVAAHPKSVMTGRLLAGFGLDNVVTPFQIGSDAHLKGLKSNDWEEFRNQTADMNGLSHGWAHSFYSDYISITDSTALGGGSPSVDRSPNRGIIFAAYTKRKNEPMIPSNRSAARNEFFDRLLSDATTLVDALIDWT